MQSGKAGYAPIRNADKHRHSGASMGTSSSLSTRIQIATGPRIQEKTSDVIGRAMNNVTPSLPVQHNRCPTEPRRTTVSCTLARTRKRPKESFENAMRLEARLRGACAPCCRVSHSGRQTGESPIYNRFKLNIPDFFILSWRAGLPTRAACRLQKCSSS